MKKEETKETKTTKKVVKTKPVKKEIKEECNCSKNCTCTARERKLVAVIIFLIVAVAILSGVLLNNYFRSNNSKLKNTKWLSYIKYGDTEIKQEFEFTKGGKFKYTNINGDEKSEPLEGTYKEYDDFTVLYITNEQDKDKPTNSYFVYIYDDYICLTMNCEEFDRFYKSDDKRAKDFKDAEAYIGAQGDNENTENNENNTQENNVEEPRQEPTTKKEPKYVEVSKPTIYIFHGETCPHCIELLDWIKDYKYKKGYEIVKYEVWNNQDNANLMQKVANYLDEDAGGVPFIVIGDKVIKGFSKDETPSEIDKALDEAYKNIENKKYYDVIKTVQ